jgi:hypothetical protein
MPGDESFYVRVIRDVQRAGDVLLEYWCIVLEECGAGLI